MESCYAPSYSETGACNEFWAEYGQKPFAELVSACCEPTKEEAVKERWNRSLLARAVRHLTR